MKNVEQIERLLGQTPAPCVMEGPHREQLKQRLLEQLQTAQPRSKQMKISVLGRMSPMMKVAASFLMATVLVGSGWAAEKIYEKLKFSRLMMTMGREDCQEGFTLPDGTKIFEGSMLGSISVDANDPNAIEEAKRHFEEIKQLIAQKKYKFVKTMDWYGTKQYLYVFRLGGHKNAGQNFDIPLETVTSWEDYVQKRREKQEKIYKAILAGKFRLVDCDEVFGHLCRDVESGEKIQVTHGRYEDGKEYAQAVLALPEGVEFTSETAAKPRPMQTTSWQEHLDLIRNGKRELLDVNSHKLYSYEVTLADGSKVTFNHDKVLKKPEAK